MKSDLNRNQPYSQYVENKLSSPHHPLPDNIILKCSSGNSSTVNLSTSAEDLINNPIPVASVSIDTSKLCSPLVTIDFSSSIHYIENFELFGRAFITFQLSRICKNSRKIPLKTWNYEISSNPIPRNAMFSRSFNFIYCECDSCPGCCTYVVEIIGVTTGIAATFTIGNITLRALAASNCTQKKISCESAILKCNNGAGVTLPENTPPSTYPIVVASINIDTSSLYNPTIVIDFSSIIFCEIARMQFQLNKICKGQKIPLGSWYFQQQTTTNTVQSFSFSHCECDACQGCCTYTVEILNTQVLFSDVIVNNAVLRILAVSNPMKNEIYPNDIVYGFSKRHCTPIVLNCSGGSGTILTTELDITVDTLLNPIPLGSITVDTSDLYNSLISIDFSCLITAASVAQQRLIDFTLQLSKFCNGTGKVHLQTWNYTESVTETSGLEGPDSFKFIYCDHSSCSECCVYTVELTSIKSTSNDRISVAITGVTLKALAVST